MRKLKILVATLAATLLLASPVFAQEADEQFALDIDSGFLTHETSVEVPGALDVNLTFFGRNGD